MFYTAQNQKLDIFISYLLKSISSSKQSKYISNGTYTKADECLKTVMENSENFILEFYSSYSEMKGSVKSNEKSLLYTDINKTSSHKLDALSKKAHFCCFAFNGNLGVKRFVDLETSDYVYLPIKVLSEYIIQDQSLLGLRSIEFVQYFNLLRCHYNEEKASNCYVINIHKKARVSVYSFNQFNQILEHNSFN